MPRFHITCSPKNEAVKMPTGFFIYDFVEAESPLKCFSEGVRAGSRTDQLIPWEGVGVRRVVLFFWPKKGGGVAHASGEG